ncbi:MAG: oligopeptide/dipeptide ABC transporter ATP-binding protein [Acidobacteriota bacterium]
MVEPSLRVPAPDAVDALACRRLVKTYPRRGSSWGRQEARVEVVSGVSLAVARGEIYGLVGRSGAGKSTVARLLAMLERPDSGEVHYCGQRVDGCQEAGLRSWRRLVQMVFQDSAASLDPLQRVAGVVSEPLAIHRLAPRRERPARIADLLASVGLPTLPEFLRRRPRHLSGGERQRLAIARALACRPQVLILDEPVSAVDISVRGLLLNLLLDLRERLGLAMVLIAHDLAMVAQVCDRVAVMLAGRVVEEGAAGDVMGKPLHPHTQALLAASGLTGPEREITVPGQAADGRGQGCPWLEWCGRAQKACQQRPDLAPAGDRRQVACYFALGEH